MRLVQLAELLNAELRGDTPELEVSSIASVKGAQEGSVVFVEEESFLSEALASSAAAVIVSQKLAHAANGNKPVLIAKQPKLAFARAARLLRSVEAQAGIHPTAVIEGTAIIGRRVLVGAHAVIEAGVRIGEDSIIDAGVVVGKGVTLGRECHLYPRVVLYPGVELGDHVVVHAGAVLGSDGFGYVRDEATGEYLQFPQQGRLIIEGRVEIGANSTIDRGALDETRISAGVKIDNLVHIGHNVLVGKDVVIAAQTGISGSSVIGENAIVGGQVGIGDHAHIGEKVILGSGSGILSRKKIKGPGVVFWGTPAKPLKDYLKELATLSSLTRAPEKKKKRKKE